MDYLVFRLYGPLASWGEIAVGESRHSAAYPSKSALLGLIAAALGIKRSDEECQGALASGYQFAVKVLSSGHVLRDYHTTQAPDSVGKVIYRTRRDEVVTGKSRLGTIISNREYRCDAFSLVAVRSLESAPFTLSEIREALQRPKYHLYLGRKGCPLAAPLNSHFVSATGFGEALDSYPYGALFISDDLIGKVEKQGPKGELVDSSQMSSLSSEDRYVFRWGNEPARYYWEGESADLRPQQVLVRHDQPLSRVRWQFTSRKENLFIRGEGK